MILVAEVAECAAFRNLKGSCNSCRESNANAFRKHHKCAVCKAMSCRRCFGAPLNAQVDGQVYTFAIGAC